MINKQLTIEEIIKDKVVRTEVARKSFRMFCAIYFPEHLEFRFADFQEEIINHAQDKALNNMIIVAFRGSGKSTIMNLMYTIWSIMGFHGMRNICIVSRTQEQARLHFHNIKSELETNQLLKSDLGPFKEEQPTPIWNASSLTLTRYGARITAVSTDQSVRGMKYGANRPDLIIADDLEDIKSVRSATERDNTYTFFKSELILGGATNARVIVLGNLLHEDSLIMRLKKEIEDGNLDGHYYEYPLVDDNDKCLWPEKFPTPESIEVERKRVGSPVIWQREMLLKIVPDDSQIIENKSIQYHDSTFANKIGNRTYRHTMIGVDLAVSTSSTADFTAIVVGDIYGGHGMDDQILIRPFPINKRMEFPEILETIKLLIEDIKKNGRLLKHVLIEDVGYQKSTVQTLERIYGKSKIKGVPVRGDKATRLQNTVFPIQQNRVLFPKKDAEKLIDQLTRFPTEKHDDLVDAFSLLVNYFLNMPRHNPVGIATASSFSSAYIHDPHHTDKQDKEAITRYYVDLQRKLDNGEIRT